MKTTEFNTILEGLTYYTTHNHAAPSKVHPIHQPSEKLSRIKIDSRTMEHLVLGDSVTKTVNRLLDKGNQVADVLANRFEPLERVAMCRRLTLEPIESGIHAGNCDEHAKLCCRIIAACHWVWDKNEPIIHAKWAAGDHEFVILGDPRAVSHPVVVDAWPMLPSAHTLDQNTYVTNGGYSIVQSYQLKPEDLALVKTNLHRLTTDEFELHYSGGIRTEQQRQRIYERGMSRLSASKRYFNTLHADVGHLKYYALDDSCYGISFDFNIKEHVQESFRKVDAAKQAMAMVTPEHYG